MHQKPFGRFWPDLMGMLIVLLRPPSWIKRVGPRGVAIGGLWVYIPAKSVQVNFLWGKNDIRMAIEH